MTVEENIMFPLIMFTNQTEEENIERVNFCLKRVNLEGKNNLMPAENKFLCTMLTFSSACSVLITNLK